MQLKPGVKAKGLQPEILLAIMVAQQVYRELNKPLVITSLLDGVHMNTSLHYKGLAVDLRIFIDIDVPQTVLTLKQRLGGDYDVVQESDHIHIEFQPEG
jgi:hypothetical protein